MNNRILKRILNNWPAKIIALAVAIFVVIYNDARRLEERFFSVPLDIVVSDTLILASEVTDGVRIGLRGEPDSIFSVRENDIRAYVDFSSHRSEGNFRGPIRIERRGIAASMEPLEVTVEPFEVTVDLERREQRSVTITPITSGFPPPGYRHLSSRATPERVLIEGPRSLVEGVDEIRTEDIDLTGRQEDFAVSVRLVRPDPLVNFPGGDVVDVQGMIEETVIRRRFEDIEIILLGLDPSLDPAVTLPGGNILGQGRQNEIDAVRSDQARLVVNASEVTAPGSYELPVRPELPLGILVLQYEPQTIEIEFQSTVDGALGE